MPIHVPKPSLTLLFASMMLVLSLAMCSPERSTPPLPDTPTPASIPALPGQLVVTWAHDGDLFVRTPDDTPRQIAGEGALHPYLSPEGSRIAFTRGTLGLSESLWVIDRNGENERQLDAPPLIGQVAWLDETTLYFNTLELDTLGTSPRDDLYRADPITGAVTQIEPGGHFSISPDGAHLVVITPGEYGAENGRIQVIDPLGEVVLVNLLEFPAVATGAHYRFYPEIHWLNNQTIRLAVPEADAIYNELATDTPPVHLWQLSLDGETVEQHTIPASIFGLPRWSPQWMTYIKRGAATDQLQLMVAGADGADSAPYAEGEMGTLQQIDWIAAERFVYIHAGAYWIGQPGQEPQRWFDAGEVILPQPVITGGVMIFAVLGDSGVELRYAAFGEASILIAPLGETTPVFDAVLVGR